MIYILRNNHVYMNKARYNQKAQEGLLRKGEQNNPDFVQELVNSGEAFTDLDQVTKKLPYLCVFSLSFSF